MIFSFKNQFLCDGRIKSYWTNIINFSCAFSIFIYLGRNVTLIVLLPSVWFLLETMRRFPTDHFTEELTTSCKILRYFFFKLDPYILKTVVQQNMYKFLFYILCFGRFIKSHLKNMIYIMLQLTEDLNKVFGVF